MSHALLQRNLPYNVVRSFYVVTLVTFFLLSSSAISSLIAMMPRPQIINEKKEDGFTALHLASLNGHLEGAEVLIQKVFALCIDITLIEAEAEEYIMYKHSSSYFIIIITYLDSSNIRY